ncbi:DNA-methyltransferase [Solidesulfovibrio sp. C21]|uniref:DNA-methyltransferase n=1 Tax=Solidesulfovibrio sp. C21 TaxID=3398613 RepID=UPI0039FC394C
MLPQTIFDNGVLYTGDALAVLKELPADSVDMVLTDPPYSSGGLHLSARQAAPASKYQASGTKKVYPPMLGDLKDQRSFVMWATLWLGECWRLAKSGAPCLVFCDWRQLPAMTDAIQAAGWLWKGIVVWHKPNARPTMGAFRHDAEFVIHAAKEKMRTHTRQCFPGVFHYGVDPRKKVHLTGKPVALVKDLLAVAATGANVLDPFLGGGTTALACVETGRRFIGVELSPEYAALAAERIHVAEASLQ